MVTKTSAQLVTVNSELSDTITVSNMGGYTGDLAMTLYGPYKVTAKQSCDSITTEAWDAAVKAGNVKAVGDAQTFSITGDSEVQTTPVKVTAVGCYTWGGQLDVTDVADGPVVHADAVEITAADETVADPLVSVVAPLGVAAETSLVISSTFTTATKTTSDTIGAQVSDQIMVTDSHGATGQISGQLRGPVVPASGKDCPSITEAQWTAADTVAETKVAFTGDGTVETSTVKPTKPGCYTWVQKLTLDASKGFTVTSNVGEPTETFELKAKIISGLLDEYDNNPAAVILGGVLLLSAAAVAGVLITKRLRRRGGRRYAN